MKPTRKISACLLIMLFSSIIVKGQSKEKSIIVDTVVYKVQIINPERYKFENGYYDYSSSNIEPSKRQAFLEPLFDDINSGKIKVYDYKTGIELSKLDVENIRTSTEEFKVKSKLDADSTIKVKTLFSNARVNAFLFKEVWAIDTTKNILTKKVVAYCPMIDKYNSNPNGVKIFAGETPLYWIKVKKEDSKISATILTDKIAYQLGANDMYTGFLNISSKVSNAVNLITVKNAIKNPSNIFRDRDFIEPFTLEEFKSDVISFFDKGISLKSINENFLDCLQFVESWRIQKHKKLGRI